MVQSEPANDDQEPADIFIVLICSIKIRVNCIVDMKGIF